MKRFYFLRRLGVLCDLCMYVHVRAENADLVLGGCNSSVLYGLKLCILMKHRLFFLY